MDLRAIAEKLTVDEIVAVLSQNQESQQRVQHLNERVNVLVARVEQQERQLDWYRRQVFGAKSERRILDVLPHNQQLWLGEQMLDAPETPPEPGTTVRSYERRQRTKTIEFLDTDSRLRFDETVPMEVIRVPNPELDGLAPEQIQEISERVTYRLAQRSAYVVLKYVQPVVKRLDTGKLVCPPAPPAVIERSVADVSFLAGLVVDKFQHHLPLYRQHQRLEQAGIGIHRGTLTRLVHRTGELIEPIYQALLSRVLLSPVLIVDESPTPAGVVPGKPGKMKNGYFWAFYTDPGEVAFLFSPSRARKILDTVLASFHGTLVSDGYSAYESYVKEMRRGELRHGLCWVHTRRNFVEAERFMPEKTAVVLTWIQQLYQVEEEVAGPDLERRRCARQKLSKPIVDDLFAFFKQEHESSALLPSNPFLQAVEYALAREKQLRIFLDDPAVPMDTNPVERALRPPAVGRKNWMFHLTEVGARYAAMFYSLIESCKLCSVNPSVYFVDILQRIDCHPASDVHLLVPRLWKEHFSQDPMRSDLSRSF